jgi:hypothetical protein
MAAMDAADSAARSSKPTVRPFGLPRQRELQAIASHAENARVLVRESQRSTTQNNPVRREIGINRDR